MPKILDVYLHHDIAGRLTQDRHGDVSFLYAESWLQNPTAISLSHSLPLQKERFSRKKCHGFFSGILPEEDIRGRIARILGISENNDFSMLEKIGGECAGAVTFLPTGAPPPERDYRYRYRELSDKELIKILRELPRRPLLAGAKDIRMSLAGAQNKIAVHVHKGRISLPFGSSPSTHILKPGYEPLPPGDEGYKGLVFNEAFCLKLAEIAGLPAAKAEIGKAGDIDYLLVERYDRKETLPVDTPSGRITFVRRLHQEDFCQALNITPKKKYQSDAGPSLKQCFDLLRDASSAPVIDIPRFLDAVIFNYLIGNHDAHGKNFSLIYDDGNTVMDRGTRLAPLYDLVCTEHYPELPAAMAMKIGGEYESAKILPKHFECLADEAGLAKPITRKRAPELAQKILANLDSVKIDHKTARGVKQVIRKRCEHVLQVFKE